MMAGLVMARLLKHDGHRPDIGPPPGQPPNRWPAPYLLMARHVLLLTMHWPIWGRSQLRLPPGALQLLSRALWLHHHRAHLPNPPVDGSPWVCCLWGLVYCTSCALHHRGLLLRTLQWEAQLPAPVLILLSASPKSRLNTRFNCLLYL